jgi:hypothetical protein
MFKNNKVESFVTANNTLFSNPTVFKHTLNTTSYFDQFLYMKSEIGLYKGAFHLWPDRSDPIFVSVSMERSGLCSSHI